MSDNERLVEIETKLAFHDQSIEDLHQALVEKEQRVSVLEETVARLEKALKILASRTHDTGEVAGAHPEEDPVPRSG